MEETGTQTKKGLVRKFSKAALVGLAIAGVVGLTVAFGAMAAHSPHLVFTGAEHYISSALSSAGNLIGITGGVDPLTNQYMSPVADV
jgi:hypothetical protein